MDTSRKDKRNTTLDTVNDFQDYMKTRIRETKGLVEATSAECHELYFRIQQGGHKLEQISDGVGQQIGTFYGHSVFISLRWFKVDDVLICFYDATSRVVDHDMVKQWLKAIFPHIKPGATNDTMNVHNTLNAAGCERTVESIRNSITHVDNEFKWQKEQLNKALNIKLKERELEVLKNS